METTTVDLAPDPGALDHWNALQAEMSNAGSIDPAKFQSDAGQFARDVKHFGSVTRVGYDRSVNSYGPDASGSFGLELGAIDNTTNEESWKAEDAQYQDPQTGEWMNWDQCLKQ